MGRLTVFYLFIANGNGYRLFNQLIKITTLILRELNRHETEFALSK